MKHIKSEHRIICFTRKDTFESVSKMIDHRRINHPSHKMCSNFPYCERGDQCLFKHEGSNDEILSADVNQAHREENEITFRTCTQESIKPEIMVHRKIDHLSEVNMRKNISTAGRGQCTAGIATTKTMSLQGPPN